MKKILLLQFALICALVSKSQNYNWAFRLGGSSGNDVVYSVDYDNAGNIYVAGSFEGQVNFNPDPNQATYLTSTGLRDIFMAKYDPQGNIVWAVRTGATGVDEAKFIRVNRQNGDIYLGGTFQNSVDFDFGSPSAILTASGGYDIFFARYSSAGALLYARRIGNTNIELLDAMDVNSAANNNGEITLMGRFTGTVDFDPNSAVVNLVANGSEMFIAKYSNTFSYQAAYKFGAGSVYGKAVNYDNTGNAIYITGGYNGTVDFDFGASTNNLQSLSTNNDVFLAKYNSSLTYQWAASLGGTNGAKEGRDIMVDANGDVLLTGAISGSVDLDPGASLAAYTSAGGSDIFLSKYSGTNGSFVWGNLIGGSGSDAGNSLATDASGNIYLSGAFQATVDFDPSSSTNDLISNGGDDICFAKYDNSGSFLYARGIGASGNQVALASVIPSGDNLHIVGHISSTGNDFDPNAGTQIISALGGTDGFVAKYSACPAPQMPTSQASVNNPCANDNVTLTLSSGFLGGAANWQWYTGSCGGTSIGSGTQVVVAFTGTANVYVRAEGGCLTSPGICSNPNPISTMALPTISIVSSNTTICSGQSVGLVFTGAGSYTLNNTPVNGNSITVSPSVTTTYTISGTTMCTSTTTYVQSVVDCTSINGFSVNNEIAIYPNPSTGEFYIKGSNTGNINIINQLGQLQKFSIEADMNNTLRVSGLAPGIYFVSINGNKKTIFISGK